MTASKPTAFDVADYLNGLPGTTARPVEVRIGKTLYVGAEYAVPDVVQGTCLYLLADKLPACYRRRKATYFATGRCTRWLVAGYRTAPVPAEYAAFHPVGPWFGLHQWTQGQIDDGEPVPYRRVEMTIHYLSR